VALNEILNAPRVSRDIDLFHDAGEAVLASWTIDQVLLTEQGYDLSVIRKFPAFVEAVVSRSP